MHEWHGTRRRHVGKRLPHEGLILMGAGHLHQHNLVALFLVATALSTSSKIAHRYLPCEEK
jgi:hypothetical protein